MCWSAEAKRHWKGVVIIRILERFGYRQGRGVKLGGVSVVGMSAHLVRGWVGGVKSGGRFDCHCQVIRLGRQTVERKLGDWIDEGTGSVSVCVGIRHTVSQTDWRQTGLWFVRDEHVAGGMGGLERFEQVIVGTGIDTKRRLVVQGEVGLSTLYKAVTA